MDKDIRNINDFRIVGISYKKTDADIRGQFAVNNDQYVRILTIAPQSGIKEIFILSTCNRTEIYGFASNYRQMMDMVCAVTEGDPALFAELAYTKSGPDAIEHLFKVSAGLDSQILGDYEILGQIKTAARFSKEAGFFGPFLERLVNSVLQSSKAIKTHTALSGGTVSVSFAAIQYIKEHVASIASKKIVLLGTGKMGRNTCKNLVHYLNTNRVTLINRTAQKAVELAAELNLSHAPVEMMNEELHSADVIIVSTNASHPVVLASHVTGSGEKMIIDLSVPCNVEPAAQQVPGVTFINIDELSRIKDKTLEMRQGEVPKALHIINEHITEFDEWCNMRKHVPMLKEVKHKLRELNNDAGLELAYSGAGDDRIQKVLNVMAMKMRSKNTIGCHYIEAINEFIA
ncbi:MAG: glutamyl-tRNA reductase [Flavipsychrobacter sp.]|nr:glutamyl-tRNA reductase [Flavipsychrobacter sp.]